VSARTAWRGLDDRLRAVIAIVAALMILVVALAFVDRATRGRQPGTTESRGSARSTADDGARAFRTLLGRYGVATRDQAGALPRDLPADTTLVVLDGEFPSAREIARARAFVARGGHLVLAGPDAAEWVGLRSVGTTTRGPAEVRESVAGRSYRVRIGSEPRWITPDGSRLVRTERIGRGRVTLVSTSAPFRNTELARADNAAFALAVVGDGPVVFAEGAHGLSAATGFAAVPTGWRIALFGTPLALLLAAIARGRRIGGAEPAGRPFAPARRESVDLLGTAYERSRQPEIALAAVGCRVRDDLRRRLDLPADAPPEAVRAAAVRAGWDAPTIDAAFVAPTDREQVLALGRALARTRKGTP
jgi:hypothetical protein